MSGIMVPMTPQELINILQDNIQRTAVYIGLENDNHLYDVKEGAYIFFSAQEKNRNQATNKTAPLVLMVERID